MRLGWAITILWCEEEHLRKMKMLYIYQENKIVKVLPSIQSGKRIGVKERSAPVQGSIFLPLIHLIFYSTNIS